MLRSILSIAACVVAWGLGWVTANLGLARALPGKFDANGVTTDPVLLLGFFAISMGLSVFAGWLCVQLVKRSPMKHVFVLALIQLGIGIVVQTGVWDLMPLWYHLAFLAAVVPMHLLGGRIALRRGAADTVPGTVETRA